MSESDNPLEQITFDRLFRATQKVTIRDKVYTVRALTDLEHNLRHRQAVLARAKIARLLENPESDEYLQYFGTYEELSDKEMLEFILLFSQREAWRNAHKDITYTFLPYPDDATEAERDEVNIQRQKMLDKMQADKQKYVDEYIKSERARLELLGRDKLNTEYLKSVRESVLITAFSEEIDIQTIFISLDGALTLSDVRKLGATVRQRFLEKIQEVDNIDPLLSK